MTSKFDKLKKNISDEVDDLLDINEESDLSVTEKKVKQGKFLK